MKRICAVGLLIGFVLVSGAEAWACSYSDGVLFPSNYDSVKAADAIILAEAVSFERDEGLSATGKLGIRTIEAIKGTFNGQAVAVPTVSSCFGYDYSQSIGLRLLMLLNEAEGQWFAGSPVHTINGEMSGAGGSWEAIARHYARIATLNDYELEKIELRNLQQAARMNRQQYPVGLDKDIESYFAQPYPTRSYRDLFDLYRTGTANQRRDVLWVMAHGKHKDARPLMQSLMRSSEFINYIGPVTAYVNATKDQSSVDVLGGAYLGIGEKETRWPIMNSLIQLAGPQHMGLMLAVLRSADIEEAGRLSKWFVRFPDDEATRIIRDFAGTNFGDIGRYELATS